MRWDAVGRSAESNSAIQQIENLRYSPGPPTSEVARLRSGPTFCGISKLSAAVLAFLWCVATAFGGSSRADSDLTVMLNEERGVLEMQFKGQKLLVYAFATNQFKPYVRELYTLKGDNVVRDAPADHLHHHGLMYAIRVNGVNFWEEVGEPGHERSVKLVSPVVSKNARGLPQASFSQVIHWIAHANRALADTAPVALLIEKRTLTVIVDEAKEEVALAWRGDLQVGKGAQKVTLYGSEYNGLGLRLPVAWDRVARHENSEHTPSSSGGKPEVLSARWSAVSHTREGRATQVVLCAPPRRHAGTNRFFTMTEPFTYMSATQGLNQAALEYRAGEHFRLDYIVLVYPAARKPTQIEERYQAWISELKATARP